jgi:hypothetical protein
MVKAHVKDLQAQGDGKYMTLLPKVDTQKEHNLCLFIEHFGDDGLLDD